MIYYKRIPFDSLENARDLGGYAVPGGVTRYGVFLRSELPEHMTAADYDRMQDYGVTRSVDLRSGGEAEREPSGMLDCPGVTYISLPMFDELAAAGSASQRKAREPGQFPGWDETYIDMLEQHRDWSLRVMELMAEGTGCTHFHCYTGKDRTGLCTAMLLSIAGADPADICADYAMSMAYLTRRYARMAQMIPIGRDADGNPNLSQGFYATSPAYMQRLLAYLERQYGGMLGYLRACGVTEAVMQAIRDKLVQREP